MIRKDERLDDLQYKNLKLIQKINGFCFGIDAVLLANFLDVKKGDRILDLGTGTGIIPILIAAKSEALYIKGIEIQPEMADMAKRSVELNNLKDKIEIINGDLKEAEIILGKNKFDIVVTNPPYMPKNRGLVSSINEKAISRHEILCTLEDVICVSSKILKSRGQLAMIHRPGRIADILCFMRKYSLEPKFIRFVHSGLHKKPELVLIKANKGANPEVRVLEPLYIYDDNGNYSNEINRIYCKGEYAIE